jgi:hypothetical protein
MRGVLAAKPAVFFEFQSRGCVLFVFLRRIIAAFAFITRQRDDEPIFFLCHDNPTPVPLPKNAVALCTAFWGGDDSTSYRSQENFPVTCGYL